MEFITVQWKMHWVIDKSLTESFQKFINQCGGVAVVDCHSHSVEVSFPKGKLEITNHSVEVEDE